MELSVITLLQWPAGSHPFLVLIQGASWWVSRGRYFPSYCPYVSQTASSVSNSSFVKRLGLILTTWSISCQPMFLYLCHSLGQAGPCAHASKCSSNKTVSSNTKCKPRHNSKASEVWGVSSTPRVSINTGRKIFSNFKNSYLLHFCCAPLFKQVNQCHLPYHLSV